ncbi:hypothetical protein [Paraburkholderia dipogonis]|uniref:hypothetical protein n=1 Tax=Paraburkholderia dipogonis TaxID=1211383 RepID=UPI0038BCDD93
MFRPIPQGIAIKKKRFTQALVRRVKKITFPIEKRDNFSRFGQVRRLAIGLQCKADEPARRARIVLGL